jgi:hypothetical protein
VASIGDTERNVTITFIGKDNASRAMNSISSSTSRTTKIVGGLVKALKYAAIAAAVALAAAAALLAKGLWNATKAAYADRLAMEKLAYSQEKAQDATKAQIEATSEWIDKMELATRFADDDLRPALTQLALTGMSVTRSQELLSIAMDVAEAKGKPLITVAEALAKGYNGTTTSLAKMGVKVVDASGDALKFSEILETLKERTKGAAREAANADPWTVLGHAFSQLSEKVGDALLPTVLKFSRWMIKVAVPWLQERLVPAVEAAADWLGKNLPRAADAIRKWWNKYGSKAYKTITTWLGENLPKAADAIREWWDTSGREAFSALWEKLKVIWEKVKDLVAALGGNGGANQKMTELGDTVTAMIDGMTAFADAVGILVGWLAWIETHGSWLTKLQWIADHATPLQVAADLADGEVTIPAVLVPGEDGEAKGGWLKRAQGGWSRGLTLVGEHGPELISNRGYVKSHSQSMGMGGAPVVINVNGAIDPVGTARQIRNILAKGDRASGRAALGLA